MRKGWEGWQSAALALFFFGSKRKNKKTETKTKRGERPHPKQ
jgi:hypothetical protein